MKQEGGKFDENMLNDNNSDYNRRLEFESENNFDANNASPKLEFDSENNFEANNGSPQLEFESENNYDTNNEFGSENNFETTNQLAASYASDQGDLGDYDEVANSLEINEEDDEVHASLLNEDEQNNSDLLAEVASSDNNIEEN